MNTLTVDIGNSCTKLDFWTDMDFLHREVYDTVSVEDIVNLIHTGNVMGCIVSSVRKDTKQWIDKLKEKADCIVEDFDLAEIEKYYDLTYYRGKLGADRMAAIAGANVLFPDMAKLVVDLGTAMTIDVVDSEDTFRGGNISPGLFTRMKALALNTGRLPEVKEIGILKDFGFDTESAIAYGAVNGVTGEILYSFQRAREEYKIELCVLTGGDACRIEDNLKGRMSIKSDPYLVGRGLNFHLLSHYLHCSA